MNESRMALHGLLGGLVLLAGTNVHAGPPPPPPIDELIAFYLATDGDHWHRNDHWLDEEVHHCDWYGIFCQDNIVPRSIHSIGLPNNNLTGDMTEIVGLLHDISSQYRQLDLGNNRITGQLLEFPRTHSLNLSQNLLGGLLPEAGDFIGRDDTDRSSIRLAGNQFTGPIPPSWEDLKLVQLDLSGNQISGDLAALPTTTPIIRLADNYFTGPLPEIDASHQEPLVDILDLSGNLLTGPVPESWAALELGQLNLSRNLLDGSIQPAMAAMSDERTQYGWSSQEHGVLWLADNGFDGVLDPEWFVDWQIGSINLCWTDVEIDDPDLDDWIAERHMGGPHHACLGREREPMDPSLSGSWYNPQRDGEGFTMMTLDTGAPLIYWFTHVTSGRQMWQFSVGTTDETTLHFRAMHRTRGNFDAGFAAIDQPIIRGGRWRLDRVADEVLHGEHLIAYSVFDVPGQGMPSTPPPLPDSAVRRDYQRLTRLAGTTCDNQQPHQWISGAWYDPQRNGQGFIVEVIENGRGVVYWFTYIPQGQRQVWMMGDGDFDGTTLTIDNLLQPRDTENGMPFDASGIENIHWGTLTIEFDDDSSGHIWFDSVDEDYGAGDYPIERLARPMLAECEED